MDVISMARELGKAIQQDDRYTAYNLAKQANDNDQELQKLIGDFNITRMNINKEMSSENRDDERIKALDEELKSTYAKIMSNKNMIVFNSAQNGYEQMMNDINQIITMCANGEDPDTCEISHGCSGSCATCGGCH
ncbi:MAG: YlbF family regulator [Ruminococcus sp.]|nr:YlbF family regulator [Ruminococcus sp.]MBQ9956492.1 YlbF family regulator [Ruminococcus sp.]MBR6792596.1 YlbF family regulator [Ruminococcus sp.]